MSGDPDYSSEEEPHRRLQPMMPMSAFFGGLRVAFERDELPHWKPSAGSRAFEETGWQAEDYVDMGEGFGPTVQPKEKLAGWPRYDALSGDSRANF